MYEIWLISSGGMIVTGENGSKWSAPLYRHWGSLQAVRPIGWVQLYSFLTTTLEGVRGQRHAPAALYLRERPGTPCTGGWVGPRTGLDRCGKSRPPPGFDRRTVEPVVIRYTDWATRPTKTGVLGCKPILTPLWAPQILHRLAWHQTGFS